MPWIKVDLLTPDKPEIWQIAQDLGIDPDAAFGKMFRLWAWFDEHTEDGSNAPSVTKLLLDRCCGVTGFCDSVIKAGWLIDDGETLTVPHFDRHNGETAKKRALNAKRASKHREKTSRKSNAASVTSALPRERERERERIKDKDNISKQTDILSMSKFEENPEKKKSDRAKPVKAETVQQVFDCWKARLSTNGAKLDARRTDTIKKIIRLGYTLENCDKAFIGCSKSFYHNGYNKQGKRYCDLELILRDSKNIERFQGYADNPPRPTWRDGDEPSLEVMRKAKAFYNRVNGKNAGNVIDNETGEILEAI